MKKLEGNEHFVHARTVLLYYSLNDEVCTHEFIDKWCKSKQIVLPKVQGNELTLHPYSDIDSLQKGAYGILEPCSESLHKDYAIDLAIIPGVAFDKEGHRLGRGKGYYDRLFAQPRMQQVYKIGLAFPFQILHEVVSDSHDIKMDEVILL